jgi:lipoprotein Spr
MKLTKMVKRSIAVSALILSFIAVQLPGSGIGTAHAASYASASASTQKADNVVKFAKSLQGKVRYAFGVNNPNQGKLDCSSFTKYVFASQGIELKWSSRAQSRQGTYVAKNNLKPGDLVFFSVSTKGKVNHVGIYIGNGQFIHNTKGNSVNGVIVSDLSQYDQRYITARRII